MSALATRLAEKYATATPETTGPGALVFDEKAQALLEVLDERRRSVRSGARTISLLERRVADAGDDTTRTDAKGRTVEQDSVWRPMAELRECYVIRPAASPAAAATT